MGTIVDLRPMVKVVLNVSAPDIDSPFEMEVVQSFPRSVIYGLRAGETVEMRLSPDRSSGAIVWEVG